MKKALFALVALVIFSVPAHGQMDMPDQKNQGGQGMMGDGHQKSMMEMCMPMMKQMSGQVMMMQEMMRSMHDVMEIQKKMTGKMSPAEIKDMNMKLDKMVNHMDTMMDQMRGMMMQPEMKAAPSEPQPKQAPGQADEHKQHH